MKSLSLILMLCVGVSVAQFSILDYITSAARSLVTTTEEAPYTLVKSGEGYEERSYPAKKWVCKKGTMDSYNNDNNNMFMSLFYYIGGSNDRSQKIDMTIPVSFETLSGGSEIEMCFFIGEEHQSNPPTPSDDTVYIKERPAMTLFTMRFGGYADNESTWTAKMDELKTKLTNAGESFNENVFYWNAFNSPMRIWNRRNEVWIAKN